MFKKELREALTKRREELDTCEIEARHRQYLIDRWLRNGGDLLLSSTGASSLPIRPSELDSIPNVVKCSLPKDLIAGARVVPSTLKTHQKTAIPHYGLPSTSEQHQRIGIAHSVACQANVEDSPSLPIFSTTTLPNQTHKKFLPKDYGSNTKREEINKRLQQQMIKRPIDARDACTQTALCAETQTDPSVEIDDAVNGLSGQERMWTSEEKLRRYSNFLSLFLEFTKYPLLLISLFIRQLLLRVWPPPYSGAHKLQQPMSDDPSSRRYLSSTSIDLSQQRSHPYHPWQRYRENNRLGRFHLTDSDTQSERGRKERCVRAELEQRRKQYFNSLGDLRYNDLTTTKQRYWPQYQQEFIPKFPSHPASQPFPQQQFQPSFNSTNSLPRGWPENGGLLSMPSYQRPLHDRSRYTYGSLPRDYERRLTSSFAPKEQQQLQKQYLLQQQQPSSVYGSYSLQDLDSSNNYPGEFSDSFGREQLYGQRPDSQFDAMQNIGRQQRPPYWQPSRSLNQLNHSFVDDFQMSGFQRPPKKQTDFLDIQPSTSQFIDGNFSHIRKSPAPNELLSEYANFLNNRFIEQQRQQRIADERERERQQPLQRPFGGQDYAGIPGYRDNLPPYNDYFDVQRQMQYFPDTQQQYHQRKPNLWQIPSGFAYDDQQQQPFVYSRNETNYGARPPPTPEYGNFGWREQPFSYRQPYGVDNSYYSGYPSHQQVLQPQQQQQQFSTNWLNNDLMSNRIMPPNYRIPQTQQYTQQQFPSSSLSQPFNKHHQQHQSRSLPPSILRKRQPPLRSADESWPNELSNEWPQNIREINKMTTEKNIFPTNKNNNNYSTQKITKRSSKIKRLLLTRKYKYDNVFKDLGIRVVGGKRMPNGDLGAFISSVDKSCAQEMLGELVEGDQVLEWNGVLLSGKTYEEVERIIQAGTGEIEMIVSCKNGQKRINNCDDYLNGCEEKKGSGGKIGRDVKIAFANSRLKNKQEFDSSCWHSPNEPPPVPAHQSSNSISDEEENERKSSLPQQNLNNKEYSINDLKEYPFNTNGKSARLNGSHGYLQLALAYTPQEELLQVYVLAARALPCREGGIPPNAYVKIYLLPGRKVSNKRRTKYQPKNSNPIWDQLLEYSISVDRLASHFLEFTVYNYDRDRRSENQPLGQCLVSLGDTSIVFSGTPRWFALQPLSFSYSSTNEEMTDFDLINNQQQNERYLDYNPSSYLLKLN
ncbi:unnamed protein product [Meloidogyne enterolobii]|uniref:Uncharacterized protein n=1 Tax=Meloidogyne enterolobii TaxID=390850 RepID=A0ACB0YHC0_MELEN